MTIGLGLAGADNGSCMNTWRVIGWISLWLAAVAGFVATVWKLRDMLGKPEAIVPYRTVEGNEVFPIAVVAFVAVVCLTVALGLLWRFLGASDLGHRLTRRRRPYPATRR